MKNTGITREVDSAGRIVLPMELRRNMGINAGDALEISVDGGNIVLSPMARPLTRAELEERIGKPVFVKTKKSGIRFWIILESVFSEEVFGKDGDFYAISNNDFYDCEV